MSKINTFRVINLNYNNNAIRIEDEMFYMDGESTLLSLQNGGGKSVLVQMLLAPFVRRRYRDTVDRPFSSYFTTNKPTHLLVEWKLDGGAGYVLTGMMIRARQGTGEEETAEELEILNFVYEYKDTNPYDIEHFPFVETQGKIRKLKGFNACRALFEERKKEGGFQFQYFDMNQSTQQKKYFLKLKEYGINHEEWETIIKKINVKESGLSDLFKDAKDEAGLIEKWFLPGVESKLNQDGNRMKQFQSILLKYISQYKENQTKMERKETILKFKEDAVLICEEDNRYLQVSKDRQLHQEKLAFLRSSLENFVVETQEKVKQANERLGDLEEEKKRIAYEKSSYELYQCLEALDARNVVCRQYEEQLGEQRNERQEIKHKLQIQECAALYCNYRQESKEVLEYENKLEIVKKDETERIPEREKVGYNLRLRYEELYKTQQENVESVAAKLEDNQKNELKTREEKAREDIQNKELNKQMGQLTERIKQFDQKEAAFNQRFALSLERNIVGLYEEGTLEVLESATGKKLDELRSERQSIGQKKMNVTQQMDSADRAIQDLMEKRGQQLAAKEELEKRWKGLQEQAAERIKKMRYLDLPEEECFHTQKILQSCDGKIEPLKKLYKEQEHRSELLKEEYRKLSSGEVLKLPEEFKELMEELGLHFVMGMDWLKKNGYTEEANRILLQKNPMIPYSILLSEQELNRLKEQEVNFYTSYPIPIICKEQLSQEVCCINHGVYQTEGLSLFVAFNGHLLNEKARKELLNKKQEEIEILLEKSNRRQEDIRFYETLRNDIYYQKLTKEEYEETELALQKMETEIVKMEENLTDTRAQKSELEKEIEKLRVSLGQLGQEEQQLLVLLKMLKPFSQEYGDYQEQKVHLSSLNKKVLNNEEEIKRLDKLQIKLKDQIGELGFKLKEERENLWNLQGKCNQFKNYSEGTLVKQDLEDLEARYLAITQEISKNVAELENNLTKAYDRLHKVQEQLIRTADKYDLMEVEYNKVTPDDYTVTSLERNLELKQAAYEKTEKLLQQVEREIAVKESELARLRKDLKEKFEIEEPCKKEQIVDIEFKKRWKLTEISINEERKYYGEITKILTDYQTSLVAMAEFSDLRTKKEFDFKEELVPYGGLKLQELENVKLLQFQGEQIRDYRQLTNRLQDEKQALSKLLDRILRKSDYTDTFFHKPLETLLDLLDVPEVILEQLTIVLQSYQSLLEKLQVDIDIVEREKQKVLEMLLDYIEDIHKNLGKIDKNSTITVKDRSLKMLKLTLPIWEEQKNIYALRLKDYVEDLTKRGLERLNQNGNIEELIGAAATTRNLYDSVVGIGAITIRLYKIEAQREYPITWAQVSKNSGGEGFLSAFAVLSCLLSYMRRDDTDLFTEREEGKVIVMDNPFAQTNASHLLIPLMDIAKKSNTQLICLSGLGGESIYNRFDNIFVLNLMESGLQKDMQYMTVEHVKGDAKIYNMSTARIQVETVEQMELLF
ncbi:MAG: hypothetical protein RR056_01960 [Acetivibrio sp.]